MAAPHHPSARRGAWLRPIALGLALTWACWITANSLSAGLLQRMAAGELAAHVAFPGLVFLVGVFTAWRWALPGAVILLIEAAVSLIYFPYFMAFPPVLAAILLLTWWIDDSRNRD